jgi:hypothetical protein
VKEAAAARIALRRVLVLGIAFSSCIAQEKSLPTPKADASAEPSQNPGVVQVPTKSSRFRRTIGL